MDLKNTGASKVNVVAVDPSVEVLISAEATVDVPNGITTLVGYPFSIVRN